MKVSIRLTVEIDPDQWRRYIHDWTASEPEIRSAVQREAIRAIRETLGHYDLLVAGTEEGEHG